MYAHLVKQSTHHILSLVSGVKCAFVNSVLENEEKTKAVSQIQSTQGHKLGSNDMKEYNGD